MTGLDRKFSQGDLPPSNAWWNGQLGRLKRNALVSIGDGLEWSGGSLALAEGPRIWARLSGSSNPYGFAEVVPGPSGGFLTLAGGTTDAGGRQPAYEANGATGLDHSYQQLRYGQAGDWRFADVRYGAGTVHSTGGVGSIPFCFCDPIPATLTMTSGDPACNYGMFQSCTIQYQPTPAPFAGAGLPDQGFYSYPYGFPDHLAGDAIFYYYLNCHYNQFTLSRVYPTSPYGSPYLDGILYTWLIGGYGNTCTPFHLDNGIAFPGSDVSCSVTIDG